MCTACLLIVSRNIQGGGVCLGTGVWPAGGGGRVLARRCLPSGMCIPACNGADTPRPVNKITDRCKNITLPQVLFAGGKNQPTLNFYSILSFICSAQRCAYLFNTITQSSIHSRTLQIHCAVSLGTKSKSKSAHTFFFTVFNKQDKIDYGLCIGKEFQLQNVISTEMESI